MDDFSSCVSVVHNPASDAAAVLEVRRQLEKALAKLERDVASQERRRVENLNEMRLGHAQITEMTDRLAKARMQEGLLADKVTAWVRYLQDEKKKMLIRENRKCSGVSDELDESVNYHINLITEKRAAVDKCLEEIKERRQQHKNYLRMLKAELDDLQKMIAYWDDRSQEVSAVNLTLEERRMQLEDQLNDKTKVEKLEKTKYLELEREMMRIASRQQGYENRFSSMSNLHVSVSEAGSTTLAEGLLSDIRRLHKAVFK